MCSKVYACMCKCVFLSVCVSALRDDIKKKGLKIVVKDLLAKLAAVAFKPIVRKINCVPLIILPVFLVAPLDLFFISLLFSLLSHYKGRKLRQIATKKKK